MQEKRYAFWLLVCVFGALTAFALIFYQERMVNLDMAFQTFLILKSGSIEIQSGRFGAAATQFWPWAAQGLGLPLKGVLIAYSLGHVLWPVILALFCWKIGQRRWSLVIALVATLMTTHTFYWLSEMPQGLVFLCAVFAWMHARGGFDGFRIWEWPLWLAALWTAFYFHPLVMYAAAFICLFFLHETGRSRSWAWMHLGTLGVFGGLAFLKYKVLKLDWYDAAAIKRQEAFGKLWPHWIDLESNRVFVKWSLADYWLLWLVIAGCVLYCLSRQKWGRAALTGAWSFGFVLLVNVPFYEAVGQQFYMENLYLPLAVSAAVPLIFVVLPGVSTEGGFDRKGAILLSILFAVNLLRIWNAHQTWTDKIHWEQDYLAKTEKRAQRKILLYENQAPMDMLKMSWGSPYEFLMLSSLQHPDSARCVIVSDAPGRYDSLLVKPRLFLGTFKNYPFEALPSKYFNIRDTSAYVRE